MNNGGEIINIGTSLLAAFTGLYFVYGGDFGMSQALSPPHARGVSVNNLPPGPLDTSFFYPVESLEAINSHKSQGTSGKSGDIKGIVPLVKFLATEPWWITGQTICIKGGPTAG
jgi:NAD(P)-dependent dehydrogenase (short-subunit alcohol dehydrogenase family)